MELEEFDYFSGQPLTSTALKPAPKTLKSRRRKRDSKISTTKVPIAVPTTPAPVVSKGTSIPPIFQLLGSITGRASDFYNYWSRPAAANQPPRRGSAATNATYMTSSQQFNTSPTIKEMMLPPSEFQPPLPSILSIPVNAPPTPPGEADVRAKMATTTTSPTKTQVVEVTPSMKARIGNMKKGLLLQTTQYSNTFVSSPLMLAAAAVIVGLAITVGRPLLEIYIHKGIHYVFNFIFYATVTAAVATVVTICWMILSGKFKKETVVVAVPEQVATPVAPQHSETPAPELSRRSSKRSSRSSRRASAATAASQPPPPMMYPPYGYQQPWDEYNYPGHPPMNMYMPPSPMYQPQLYHPVPVRPFEAPSPNGPPQNVAPTPEAASFPLPPTPGHARTESGSVAAIPEILQQPKKKPTYRFVQRTVEREREVRPPLRARELPPVPRDLPVVPKHQGLPAVFTRFEDENSMINYASPVSEVDLKVGDHSFKPYGSPPRRYHGMNV